MSKDQSAEVVDLYGKITALNPETKEALIKLLIAEQTTSVREKTGSILLPEPPEPSRFDDEYDHDGPLTGPEAPSSQEFEDSMSAFLEMRNGELSQQEYYDRTGSHPPG